jgi:hypothetical protein
MRSIAPSRMTAEERIAELGNILATGLQRMFAAQSKRIESSLTERDQLAATPESMAPCGPPTEVPR